MPHPEDHNLPPSDPAIARGLAVQLAYLEGQIDLDTTVERLGPAWKGSNGRLGILLVNATDEVSQVEKDAFAKHESLQKAWQKRWGSAE